MRRPEYAPEEAPQIAQAEALQSIAVDLERIADVVEEEVGDDGGLGQPLIGDGGGVGPFYYVSEDLDAWGFVFPSGMVVIEWDRPLATTDEFDQAIYHSMESFRTVHTGRIDWGVSPEDFPGGGDRR